MRIILSNKELELSSSTTKGRREENQDSYAWFLRNGAGTTIDINDTVTKTDAKGDELFIGLVCDGMGGLCDGAMASGSLVKDIIEWASKTEEKSMGFYIDSFRTCLADAEKKIMDSYPGSGTTISMVIYAYSEWHSLHIGDSRCYLISKDRFFRTVDQSVVEEMFRSGKIDEEEMNGHMFSNIINNYIGGDDHDSLIDDDLGNDWTSLTLCSDGAFGYMGIEEFRSMISGKDNSESIVKKALEKGSKDNITVLRLLRV